MALPGIEREGTPRRKTRRPDVKDQETVELMLRLKRAGWSARRIARELRCSRNTVRRYLEQGGWRPASSPNRKAVLDGREDWLKQQFEQHDGNAEVVRQMLVQEHKLSVSLRTVERAVKPYRDDLKVQAVATVRFETAPGEQMQVDFGSKRVVIDGVETRVYIFVATLGYSRRCFIRFTRHERQSAWMQGIEAAFHHFGGVPRKVLVDNARALVTKHDPNTGEIEFNDKFHAFAKHWGFTPKACKPRRARTKGKVESNVKYAKRNCLAGHEFSSWEAMEGHGHWWMKNIADVREHGTTGEKPIERFQQAEREALAPIDGRVPFLQVRELQRIVHADACVVIDTNAYSVPWKYIRRHVSVIVAGGQVEVMHGGERIAVHAELPGNNRRSIERDHLAGIVASHPAQVQAGVDATQAVPPEEPEAELLRPLQEYEDFAGGSW